MYTFDLSRPDHNCGVFTDLSVCHSGSSNEAFSFFFAPISGGVERIDISNAIWFSDYFGEDGF